MAQPQGNRVNGIMYVSVLIVATLVLRLAFLQVIQGEHHSHLAKRNMNREVPKPAHRGLILDRNGEIIARNETRYDVGIKIDRRTDWQVTFHELADYFVEKGIWNHEEECDINSAEDNIYDNCAEDCEIHKKFTRARSHIRYQESFTLQRNIERDIMLDLEEKSWQFPYMEIMEIPVRHYEDGNFFPQLLQGMNSDRTPKSDSLESTWDEYLRGEDGYELWLVNNSSVPIQLLETKEAEPGHNLILTIDAELQRHTQQVLNEGIENNQQNQIKNSSLPPARHGGAIVLDVKTGDILAMASYPNFDVNDFHSNKLIEELKERDEELNKRVTRQNLPETSRHIFFPLWNTYGPGSTIKILTTIMGLEEGVITENQRYNDRGSYTSSSEGGTRIPNANNRVWGSVNIKEAFQVSLNTYFSYIMDNLAGPEFRGIQRTMENQRITRKYTDMFGLTGDTGFVDVTGQNRTGRIFHDTQSPIQFTVGATSTVSVSPMHMANFVSMVANRGYHYRPRLVKEIVDFEGNVVEALEPELYRSVDEGVISNSTYDIVHEAMKMVTSYGPRFNGTSAWAFNGFPIEVAAKSGSTDVGRANHAHSWWVGFAPADEPEIVVVVFTEHGGMNSHAHFMAREIMEKYFGLLEEETENDEE